MIDALMVVLNDTIAGTLTRLHGDRLQFDYLEDYQERPTSTPLSLSMPKHIRSHPDGIVRPWLWNLLPDNDAVLARWAQRFQVSASSPFSLLATPIGEDCAGAVRFSVIEEIERVLQRTGDITWLSEEDIAARLRDLRTDSTTWLGRTFSGQFSLAGAQAKTALLKKNGKWGVPTGATPTTHILKPTIAGFDDHDLNEHLCLNAARRSGLTVARSRIARFGDETAIVVDRYDRQTSDETVLRIHQEDICQALGIPPGKKYQNEGGPAALDVVQLFRQFLPAQIANDSIWRFIDALIWNWLIAGTDAHAKNYSLLLAGDQIRLAPFYDIASALPYGTHESELRLAMKLGGDYRVSLYRNPWNKVALELKLDADALMDRVRHLTARVSDAFADAAAEPDVSILQRKLPSILVTRIAERATRCAKLIDDR